MISNLHIQNSLLRTIEKLQRDVELLKKQVSANSQKINLVGKIKTAPLIKQQWYQSPAATRKPLSLDYSPWIEFPLEEARDPPEATTTANIQAPP